VNYRDVGLNEMVRFMRSAKAAHTSFERAHGFDPHWEVFYGSYVRSRLFGLTDPEAYDAAVIDTLGSSPK
jgi:hypothetical protein